MGTLRALLCRQWRLFLHSTGGGLTGLGSCEEAGRARAGGIRCTCTTQAACFWIRFGMRILTAKLSGPRRPPEPASAECHQLIEGSSLAINSHTSWLHAAGMAYAIWTERLRALSVPSGPMGSVPAKAPTHFLGQDLPPRPEQLSSSPGAECVPSMWHFLDASGSWQPIPPGLSSACRGFQPSLLVSPIGTHGEEADWPQGALPHSTHELSRLVWGIVTEKWVSKTQPTVTL